MYIAARWDFRKPTGGANARLAVDMIGSLGFKLTVGYIPGRIGFNALRKSSGSNGGRVAVGASIRIRWAPFIPTPKISLQFILRPICLKELCIRASDSQAVRPNPTPWSDFRPPAAEGVIESPGPQREQIWIAASCE